MPRRVLVTRSAQSFDLIEARAPGEHHLQEVVKGSPQLIPSDDLGLDGSVELPEVGEVLGGIEWVGQGESNPEELPAPGDLNISLATQ